MAHPDCLFAGGPVEQLVARLDRQAAFAELTATARDRSSERGREELVTIADPEHRHTELEDAGVDVGSGGLVHAAWPPGQDDARVLPQLGGLHLMAVHVRRKAELPKAPRDEMTVLAAEIDDRKSLLHLIGEVLPDGVDRVAFAPIRAEFAFIRDSAFRDDLFFRSWLARQCVCTGFIRNQYVAQPSRQCEPKHRKL